MKRQAEAVIYCRTASVEQTAQGFADAYQEATCRENAKRLGYTVKQVFSDNGHVGDETRPGLRRMLSYCTRHRKSIKAVLVTHLDRLTRNFRDYLTLSTRLNKLGIAIQSSQKDGMDAAERLSFAIVERFRQFERDLRGERIRKGIAAKRARQQKRRVRYTRVSPRNQSRKFGQKSQKRLMVRYAKRRG